MYIAAETKRPDPWESHAACQFCPIGAGNAGRDLAPLSEVTAELRVHCPRCERVTERLIKQRLCVSCYNRQREADIGQNCKGGRPQLTDRLYTERLAVTKGNGPAALHKEDRVVSRTESVLAMARTATTRLTFGMPPLRMQPVGWQMELAV